MRLVFWDEWRGSLDGRPSMYIKRLLRIPYWRRGGKWLSLRVDLHKFVRADDPECFHSHPATAVRLVLRGGYREEVYVEGVGCPFGEGLYGPDDRWELLRYKEDWTPGRIGVVRPRLIHRVDALLTDRPSYSLWLRGPICEDVRLVGEGWERRCGCGEIASVQLASGIWRCYPCAYGDVN